MKLKKSYIVVSAGRRKEFASAVDVKNLLTPFRAGVAWTILCKVSDGTTAVLRRLAECDGSKVKYLPDNDNVPEVLKAYVKGVRS